MPVGPRPPASPTRDPLSLPGDDLPPPLAATLAPPDPPGRAAMTPPRAAPLPPAPSMDDALRVAQVALARCRSDGFQVAAAVSDSAGVIIVGLKMDGADGGRIYHALRKIQTALGFGMPSSAAREALRRGDFAALTRVKPNMTVFPGAIPLRRDGKLIGALAVSGAPSAEADEVCAAAGVAAFAK